MMLLCQFSSFSKEYNCFTSLFIICRPHDTNLIIIHPIITHLVGCIIPWLTERQFQELTAYRWEKFSFTALISHRFNTMSVKWNLAIDIYVSLKLIPQHLLRESKKWSSICFWYNLWIWHSVIDLLHSNLLL